MGRRLLILWEFPARNKRAAEVAIDTLNRWPAASQSIIPAQFGSLTNPKEVCVSGGAISWFIMPQREKLQLMRLYRARRHIVSILAMESVAPPTANSCSVDKDQSSEALDKIFSSLFMLVWGTG